MSEQIENKRGAKASEWPLAVTYGIPLGVFWLALFLFAVSQNMYERPIWIQLIDWGGSFAIVYLCIREYRKRFSLPSDMKYGSAVRVGFFQSLIAAVLYAVGMWILISYVYADYLQNLLEETYSTTVGMLGDSDMADTQYALMEKILTPWFMGLSAFINGVLSGLIYALIAAAVLRRKPKADSPFQGVD